MFSTGLPPSIPAASRAAIELVRSTEGEQRGQTLASHARRFRELVRTGGAVSSAIAPIMIGDDREVMRCTDALLAQGFYVQGIRPPTVPPNTARLRVGLSAAHTAQQVESLARMLDDVTRQRNVA